MSRKKITQEEKEYKLRKYRERIDLQKYQDHYRGIRNKTPANK